MTVLGNIILFVLGLSLLIFIHELGHFLFAKLFKVYCVEFSIGMGPAIVSKKFKKDKETTYSLRALPIGGYVAMAGEVADDENEKELNIPYERTINGVNPWKRAIITIAGISFNFILALILIAIFIFGNGVSTKDNQVLVSDNSLAFKAGLSDGDKIVQIKDIKITDNDNNQIGKTYCDDASEICKVEYFTDFNKYVNSDIILNSAKEYLQQDANKDKTLTQKMTIKYLHKGTTQELTAPIVRNYKNGSFELIGISEARKTPNFFTGIALTFQTFGEIFVLMFKAIGSLFTPSGFNSLGGVISMYESSAMMASQGVLSYIWYLAVISINLGFFNLLPIPALDGARFYLSIFEGITGKKLNPKVETYLNMGGMILLFGLMIAVTIKDIIMLF